MTLTLNFPEIENFDEFEAKMILACEYYQRGKLSLGQAAKMVGIAKRTFIEIMGNFGYSVFGDDAELLLNDIRQNA